jgi:hypothetical protein
MWKQRAPLAPQTADLMESTHPRSVYRHRTRFLYELRERKMGILTRKGGLSMMTGALVLVMSALALTTPPARLGY